MAYTRTSYILLPLLFFMLLSCTSEDITRNDELTTTKTELTNTKISQLKLTNNDVSTLNINNSNLFELEMDGNRLSRMLFSNNKVNKMRISTTLDKNLSMNELKGPSLDEFFKSFHNFSLFIAIKRIV